MRRRRIVAGCLAAIVLVGGGYTIATAVAPLPSLDPVLEVAAETQLDADGAAAQAVVDAQSLPTAIGWADGDAVWSNDDAAYPLASITKLVTALVVQEAQPLEPGADGPSYTWTRDDLTRQNGYRAQSATTYPIPVGTELTTRQLLTFALVPSANEYAAALAYSAFGDNEAFVAAVSDWATRNDLSTLRIVEPTGMDEANSASAADIVRIARLVLDDPTLVEFTSMRSATMPWGVGEITNTNPLLGELPGLVGLKTGTLFDVGYSIVLAQQLDAAGRDVTQISVTLIRESRAARAADGREVLTAMAALPQTLDVVAEGEPIGFVRTWQGDKVPLISADAARAVLVPGEAAKRTTELREAGEGSAGQVVGEIRVAAPTGAQLLDVITTAPIERPGFWWRFTHPGELFG